MSDLHFSNRRRRNGLKAPPQPHLTQQRKDHTTASVELAKTTAAVMVPPLPGGIGDKERTTSVDTQPMSSSTGSTITFGTSADTYAVVTRRTCQVYGVFLAMPISDVIVVQAEVKLLHSQPMPDEEAQRTTVPTSDNRVSGRPQESRPWSPGKKGGSPACEVGDGRMRGGLSKITP